LKASLGKIIIGAAVGAGALGAGLGASLAVASAATTPTTPATSRGVTTTAVHAGSANTAATPSPSARPKAAPSHNCPNMGSAHRRIQGAPGGARPARGRPADFFVPKPARDVAYHHSYRVRPASHRPRTFSGVSWCLRPLLLI